MYSSQFVTTEEALHPEIGPPPDPSATTSTILLMASLSMNSAVALAILLQLSGVCSYGTIHVPGSVRRCRSPRTAGVTLKDQEEALPDARIPTGEESDGTDEDEYVRPPPVYPDGLHDPAKADRSGPFWSSLGEPDVSTGVRPSYLRRDDWHFSSTFSSEERQAVEEKESAYGTEVIETIADEVDIEFSEDDEEEEESKEYDPFRELENMKLEPGAAADGASPSSLPMPNSWQEYQALQTRIAAIIAAGGLSAADEAAAAKHEQNLVDFYGTFKDILAGGWKLENNVEVHESVEFVAKVMTRG